MSMEKSITEKSGELIDRNARFRFLIGRNAGKEVPIEREAFFIGRGVNNNLILEDRRVSRKHAVLNYMDGHFILSDLKSTKGVIVNGQKVNEIILQNRDRIKMGGEVIEFLEGEPSIPIKTGNMKKIVALAGIVLLGAIVIASVFFLGGNKDKGIALERMRDIEFNYSQGIEAYNLEKNVESARAYWQRVLELDPENKTVQARNARKLLSNLPPDLPSNNGGPDSR